MHARSLQLGILGSLLWLGSTEAPAQGGGSSDADTTRRIRAAIASDIRPAADTARDTNRKPLETLSFFGLRENMTVIELVPAGGWFTKIIAPVVKDRGKLHVALGPLDDVRALKAQHPELGAIEISESGRDIAFGPARDGAAAVRDTSLGVTGADLVVTFRNLHNYRPEMRALVNKAAFDALKPGGVYGVLDHTRRHMEPNSRENGRRVDPVQMIKEIQAAGFVFEDYSTIHFSPADALALEVGNPDVSNQTDRITFRFRKPE
jgi:predicted methyltransferase